MSRKEDLKKAQKWIETNTKGYKKLYGAKWEVEINRDAWDKFGVGKKKTLKESIEDIAEVQKAFSIIRQNLENIKSNTSRRSIDLNRMVRRILVNDLRELETNIHSIMREVNRRKERNYEGKEMRLKNFSKTQIINEHDDPSSYINPWIDRGFAINTEQNAEGLTFNVTDSNGRSFIINEPNTGRYVYKSQEFMSFDDAMKAASSPELANNSDVQEDVSPEDEFVFEAASVSVDRLKSLAGIVSKPKTLLKENFSEIPQMILNREETPMSRLMEKLAAISSRIDECADDENCDCGCEKKDELDEATSVPSVGSREINPSTDTYNSDKKTIALELYNKFKSDVKDLKEPTMIPMIFKKVKFGYSKIIPANEVILSIPLLRGGAQVATVYMSERGYVVILGEGNNDSKFFDSKSSRIWSKNILSAIKNNEKYNNDTRTNYNEGEEHDELVEGNSEETVDKSNEQSDKQDKKNDKKDVSNTVPLQESDESFAGPFIKSYLKMMHHRSIAGNTVNDHPKMAEENKYQAKVLFMQMKNDIRTTDLPSETKTDIINKLVNASANAYDLGVAISGGDKMAARELQAENGRLFKEIVALVKGNSAPVEENYSDKIIEAFGDSNFSGEYKNNKGGSLARPVSRDTQDFEYYTDIDDTDDDTRKKDHYIKNKKTGEVKRVDWSPYQDMDATDIANYIKAGMPNRTPDRKTNNMGPWDKKSLEKHLQFKKQKKDRLTKMGVLKDRKSQLSKR